MNEEKNQLPYVLTDLDGTISMGDFSLLKPTVDNIIAYQKASGHKFSFITGRNAIVNKVIVDQLQVKLPIISCNGALITDPKGQILDAQYLDKRTCVAIFREAANLDLDLVCYTPTAIVGTPDSNRVKAWDTYNQKQVKEHQFLITTFPTLEAIAAAITDEVIKPVELICVAENDEQREKMRTIFANYQDQIDYVQSTSIMFNALKKGVNKEYGLKKWAELINTIPEDVVCFGDNYNDIEMIKFVKHGYVVANGVEPLKKVAFKIIKTPEENGVGEQLERIMHNEY